MQADVRLRVEPAESRASYIRHARVETLRAIGGHIAPEHIEPIPYAVYLFALAGGDHPIGVAEACFLQQHYASIDEVPYAASCDLQSYCPFEQLAGIRTVYAEPEARLHLGVYPKLILAMAYIFRSLGARYSTATTSAQDTQLARLYDRTGGIRAATFTVGSIKDEPLALYLFELDALLRHPAVRRMMRCLELDVPLLESIRLRSRHGGEEAAR
jgi:hypothetical protein